MILRCVKYYKNIKNIKNINLHPKFVFLIELIFVQYYKTLKSLEIKILIFLIDVLNDTTEKKISLKHQKYQKY